MHLALLIPAIVATLAAEEPLKLEAPIRAVRVHPDEAWVTRVGTIRITTPGIYRFAIPDLPPGLTLADLRMQARGPAGTQLGELSIKSDPMILKESPEARKLRAERVPVEERRVLLESSKEALEAAKKLLQSLVETHGREIQRRLGSNLPAAGSPSSLASVLETRRAELFRNECRLQTEEEDVRVAEKRIEGLETELRNRRRLAPSTVVAEVSISKAGALELSLAQRTRDCSWSPAYEARLSQDRRRLELVLVAAIRQSTGDDWKDVRLEIATQPADTPLDVPDPKGPIQLSYREGPRPAAAGAMGSQAFRMIPAEIFPLEGPQTLPSGTTDNRFKVLSAELAPDPRFLAVPRESSEVFMVAQLRPAPRFPLYPGAGVQLLVGSQRLGSQSLAMPRPGEPLRLSFGVVPGLSAKLRTLDSRRGEAGTFHKEKEWVFQERLELGNDTEQALEIEVQDRVVQSSTEAVKVSLGPATTPGARDLRPGLRGWVLPVPAKASRFVDVETIVRAPLTGRVTNVGDLRLEGN